MLLAPGSLGAQTADESLSNTAGDTVVVDVVSNDPGVDPATVAIIGADSSGVLTVAGEGTWSVNAAGAVVFTPEVGFVNDPTNISYTTTDAAGAVSAPAEVFVDYIPVITNDVFTSVVTDADGFVALDVLANDPTSDIVAVSVRLRFGPVLEGFGSVESGVALLIDPSLGPGIASGYRDISTDVYDRTTGELGFFRNVFGDDLLEAEYTVEDEEGNVSEPATVTIETVPVLRSPVIVIDERFQGFGDPLHEEPYFRNGFIYIWSYYPDGSRAFAPTASSALDLDHSSVNILGADPATGALVVPGEGSWTIEQWVNPATGDPETFSVDTLSGEQEIALPMVVFLPEPGFTGETTPISYTASDYSGNVAEPFTVYHYFEPGPLADVSVGNVPGTPVTVDVIANDVDVAPEAVEIIDPTDPDNRNNEPRFEYVAVGEGKWTVDPDTGAITFTPEAGFVDDPTPIWYRGFLGTTHVSVTVGYEVVAVDDELPPVPEQPITSPVDDAEPIAEPIAGPIPEPAVTPAPETPLPETPLSEIPVLALTGVDSMLLAALGLSLLTTGALVNRRTRQR